MEKKAGVHSPFAKRGRWGGEKAHRRKGQEGKYRLCRVIKKEKEKKKGGKEERGFGGGGGGWDAALQPLAENRWKGILLFVIIEAGKKKERQAIQKKIRLRMLEALKKSEMKKRKGKRQAAPLFNYPREKRGHKAKFRGGIPSLGEGA